MHKCSICVGGVSVPFTSIGSVALKYRSRKTVFVLATFALFCFLCTTRSESRGASTVFRDRVISLSLMVYGSVQWKWGYDELSACFIIMAVVGGAFAKMSLSEISKKFILT
ncbi:MAG: hypothetical protein IJP86_02385 [Synergistaceae bacterium]|nr:hypothetical protein [Synergistaceae bacterium]